MSKLILMRHGKSEGNKRNRFSGWVDIPLSQEGIEEALEGGKRICHLPIDVIFTSTLIRAQMTAMLAMLHHHSLKIPRIVHRENRKQYAWESIVALEFLESCIPVYCCWELNERMYGALQGLDKDEMRKKYGPEQVQIWRRSYDVSPPEGESLKMTIERALPCFEQQIVPLLQQEKNVLIAAHGNSLRAIVMVLEGLSEEEVVHLEIPTGEPLLYEYRNGRYFKAELKK